MTIHQLSLIECVSGSFLTNVCLMILLTILSAAEDIVYHHGVSISACIRTHCAIEQLYYATLQHYAPDKLKRKESLKL
jgi:hypothetical protein